eukprot:CAMPEP_0116828128 /NCGR_PEP_ID=MMETSP0418-20121206/3486_1 /TAXON_ID=1158023 /ORGANISM="Astrosyne radiata, Strain 13vi08-1A" /LENGTH=67 /DNA_ID=CAMNT_0004456987 /DNA_START=192 /DNA_END=395 /DNA_ORIENTATION=-
MDSLPPNDPNHNNNNRPTKLDPHDGTAQRANGSSDADMDVIEQGNPFVVAMFLIGVASWLLRERFMC